MNAPKLTRRSFAALAAAGLAAPALAACGSARDAGADSPAPASSADQADLRTVTVVLDWYPNSVHAFMYAALEAGYYAEEGIDLVIQNPANDNDAIALVSAGKAEFGVYYEHDTIQAVANQGVKVKSVGPIIRHPMNIILSLKEKGIAEPKDLEGKTVGYAGTALSEALFNSMMRAAGADPSNVQLINVGFDLLSSMTTGNVDATIGCMVNHEVPELEEEGFELSYWLVSDYGIPDFYQMVFLANTDLLAEEPELVEAFLRASYRGYEDFKADPGAVLDILMNYQNAENFPLSRTVEEQSCATILPLMEDADAGFLAQDEAVWQETIDWMLDEGLIGEAVAPEEVMVNLAFR